MSRQTQSQTASLHASPPPTSPVNIDRLTPLLPASSNVATSGPSSTINIAQIKSLVVSAPDQAPNPIDQALPQSSHRSGTLEANPGSLQLGAFAGPNSFSTPQLSHSAPEASPSVPSSSQPRKKLQRVTLAVPRSEHLSRSRKGKEQAVVAETDNPTNTNATTLPQWKVRMLRSN
jgi:hypothetical protein